ncbi:MAG TPA: FtsX-like permease family protein, partial [Gemmatimonadaceae bacterium]|nr:FtsX-like permease family protein [Gemmatimonadaceae bacterium]
LAYTLGVALATGVAFGLVPALRASRPDLVPSLKGAVGGSAGKPRRVTLRDALVVVQMAVSIVLVVAGALLVRSLGAAGRVDLGYDAVHVAVMSVALQMNGYDKARGGQFLETARQRLAARPDVRGVAITSRAPLALNDNTFDFFIDGRQASAADKPFSSEGTYVDEHYAETLGLHVTSGRWFDAADRDGTRHVAVVTRAMADKYWPGADAVGREFRTRWGDPPYRVVGVVADYKVDTPGESPQPYLHIPSPREDTYAEILVRTAGPAGAAVAQLQQELRGIDPQVVFLNAGTLRDYANVRLFPVVAGAWLIGAFGLLALVVAAVGLYGVIGYSVSRRVREIGIRKALGARRASLVAMVVGEGMRLVAFGGIIGAALAVGAARALSSVLFVAPVDLPSYGIAFGVLAGVALLANVVPARRAAGVDPMVALRQD